MRNFIKVTKALSEPNRVKILKILQRRNLCVCKIQTILEIAQPTVSSHLRVLEEAGLVSYQKDGLWANYRVAEGRTPICAGVDHVTDIREIARYGIMGSPALLINGKAVAVGNVPPRGRVKKWLIEASESLL